MVISADKLPSILTERIFFFLKYLNVPVSFPRFLIISSLPLNGARFEKEWSIACGTVFGAVIVPERDRGGGKSDSLKLMQMS